MTPGAVVVRLLMVAGPLLALAASVPAGAAPPAWLTLLVGVSGTVFASRPESWAGPATFLLVLYWWGTGPEGLHPAALVAAACLLASHVAGVVAGYGPPSLPVAREVGLRWTLRGLLVLPAAALVWALARSVQGLPATPGLWAAGAAATALAMVAARLALSAAEA